MQIRTDLSIGEWIYAFFLFGMLFGFIYALYRAFVNPKRNYEQEERALKWERAKEFASFDRKTLTVKKRGRELTDCMEIREDKNVIVAYEPKRYIYTSATVGGITTGGVDVVGGYSHGVGTVDTGKYQLLFCGHCIEQIQLTDELYKKAQKSEIATYLNNKKQIVVDTGADPRLVQASAIYSENDAVGSLVLQNLAQAGLPSKEKCMKILDWLCGDD